jgi:hypothetical protein
MSTKRREIMPVTFRSSGQLSRLKTSSRGFSRDIRSGKSCRQTSWNQRSGVNFGSSSWGSAKTLFQ